LRERHISVTVAPLLSDDYVSRRLAGVDIDYIDVAAAYLSRIGVLATSARYDVLWVESECFPRWPSTEIKILRRLKFPVVIDLDDAIFHSYDRHPSRVVRRLLGQKIDLVFKHASAVVVGNEYLAERAKRAGATRVYKVPTVVDPHPYAEAVPTPHKKITFGWIGSASTAHYLRTITSELEELCSSLDARVCLIGVERHHFTHASVQLKTWGEDTEIDDLSACDIGLAPLSDGPWERGKCGLKAIQYMAIGIPVLAANVGVLPELVKHGETGFIYRDGPEFSRYARTLALDPDLRQRMGATGRERVAKYYSIHHWVDTIAEVLTEAAD
jgi:glycosyltransferase involved in cell wall biosynthesis